MACKGWAWAGGNQCSVVSVQFSVFGVQGVGRIAWRCSGGAFRDAPRSRCHHRGLGLRGGVGGVEGWHEGCYLSGSCGTWRSPVAHLNGVQGVAGSNPAVPTRQTKARHAFSGRVFLILEVPSFAWLRLPLQPRARADGASAAPSAALGAAPTVLLHGGSRATSSPHSPRAPRLVIGPGKITRGRVRCAAPAPQAAVSRGGRHPAGRLTNAPFHPLRRTRPCVD